MSIQQTIPKTVPKIAGGINHSPQSISTVSTIPLDRVVMQDIEIGKGEEVCVCDTVTIHYKGETKDGRQIDSTYKRSQPLTFTLGQGSVILGLEQGIIGMKVGGIRKVYIPSQMGFGDRAMPGIPCDSDLMFEIELLDICDW